MLYYLPVALMIVSSVMYHIFLKVTPAGVHPIFALVVTYLTAAAVTLLIYPFYPTDKVVSFLGNFQDLNWASYALGFAIVGLEVGTLLAYRASWNISLFNVVGSTTVSLLLIPVGLMLFKETLSGTTVAGLILCLVGIVLINYKG